MVQNYANSGRTTQRVNAPQSSREFGRDFAHKLLVAIEKDRGAVVKMAAENGDHWIIRECGRGERIRTSDLSVPNRAHYQAVLRPAKRYYDHKASRAF